MQNLENGEGDEGKLGWGKGVRIRCLHTYMQAHHTDEAQLYAGS